MCVCVCVWKFGSAQVHASVRARKNLMMDFRIAGFNAAMAGRTTFVALPNYTGGSLKTWLTGAVNIQVVCIPHRSHLTRTHRSPCDGACVAPPADVFTVCGRAPEGKLHRSQGSETGKHLHRPFRTSCECHVVRVVLR